MTIIMTTTIMIGNFLKSTELITVLFFYLLNFARPIRKLKVKSTLLTTNI